MTVIQTKGTVMKDFSSLAKLVQPHRLIEGFVSLTASEASILFDACRYAKNRALSPVHVSKLAEYMRRGQWLEKSPLDFARPPDGRLVLINGHHRLAAQIEAGRSLKWCIIIHDVGSEAEIQQLYYRFDTEFRKRSGANIASGLGLDEEYGLSKQTSTALWDASLVIANNMKFTANAESKASILLDERRAICDEYQEAAGLMNMIMETAPNHVKRKLLSISFFSVALVTLKHQEDKALEFWKDLCDDDGLTKGDPRKTLLHYMIDRKESVKHRAAHMLSAARAWSTFFEGRELKIMKVTGYVVPILGTPFIART